MAGARRSKGLFLSRTSGPTNWRLHGEEWWLAGAGRHRTIQSAVGRPVKADYRGYEVYKAGFWTAGPALVESLNLLEGYDLKALGHNSPEYVHTVVEALKLALADRDRYYGDPDFVKIPAARTAIQRLCQTAPFPDRKGPRFAGSTTR